MENPIYRRACEITEGRVSGRHTFFQLKHFVLGKELTTQAKMQKCLREIDARKKSMKSMVFGIEDAMDELELMRIKESSLEKKKPKGELDSRHSQIQLRKLRRKMDMLQDSIKEMKERLQEAVEETEFFIKAFDQMEAIEPLKRYDDPDANAEYWNENFMQDLRLRLMLQKPIDLELVRCILALNPESPVRREVVGILEQVQRRAISRQSLDEESDGK